MNTIGGSHSSSDAAQKAAATKRAADAAAARARTVAQTATARAQVQLRDGFGPPASASPPPHSAPATAPVQTIGGATVTGPYTGNASTYGYQSVNVDRMPQGVGIENFGYLTKFAAQNPGGQWSVHTNNSGGAYYRYTTPGATDYRETSIIPQVSHPSAPASPPSTPSAAPTTPAPTAPVVVDPPATPAPAIASSVYPGAIIMAEARQQVVVDPPGAVGTPDKVYPSSKPGDRWLDYPIKGGGVLVVNERSGDSFARAPNGTETAIHRAANDSAAIQALGANVPPPAFGSGTTNPATRLPLDVAGAGDPQTGLVPVKSLDIDYSSGPITQADIDKWKAEGIGHVVVGIQPWESPALVREQMYMLQANGIKTDTYVFLNWSEAASTGGTIEQQIDKAYAMIKDYPSKTIWFDVEQEVTGTRDPFDATQLQDKLSRAITELNALNSKNGTNLEVGIYSGSGFWADEMGNTQKFKDLPLWYAHYSDPEDPTLGDWPRQSFGGFHDIRGKQYNGGAYVGGARPRADRDVQWVPAD